MKKLLISVLLFCSLATVLSVFLMLSIGTSTSTVNNSSEQKNNIVSKSQAHPTKNPESETASRYKVQRLSTVDSTGIEQGGYTEIGPKDNETDFGRTDIDRTDIDFLDHLLEQSANEVNPLDLSEYLAAFLLRMEESPGLVGEAIALYSNMPLGNKKDALESLLIDAARQTNGVGIEKYFTEAILSDINEQRTSLYELLKRIGVQSHDSRDQLLSTLPKLTSAENISAIIGAITPQEVSSNENQNVINQLIPYVNDQNDLIRAAAIRSTILWGGAQYSSVIEDGLIDSASNVRRASAATSIVSEVRSEELKQRLLSIMHDTSEDEDTRLQAYFALTTYEFEFDDAELRLFTDGGEALGVLREQIH